MGIMGDMFCGGVLLIVVCIGYVFVEYAFKIK